MTTVQDLIHQVRTDYLLTGTREQRNKLEGAITDDSTSFTFIHPLGALQPSTRISIDLEDCYVWSVSQQQAVVERGQFGSVAAAHNNGAMVYVNPRFSDAQILRAFNDELRALSSPANGLFRMRTFEFTYNPVVDGYNFAPTDYLSAWQAHYRVIGPEIDWKLIPRNQYKIVLDASTTDFAAGKAVFLYGYADTGQKVRVTYRSKFSPLSAAGDDITTVSGLHAEAVDVLTFGAALRLCAGREIHRNFDETQGETRRAEEVPPGANLQALRGVLQQYEDRKRQEAARLARLYPDSW